MPLFDDLRRRPRPGELRRRKFLGLLGAGALGVTGAGTAAAGLSFMRPAVFYEAESRFRVGRPEDFAVGDIVALSRQGVYVVRSAVGFYAMTATCTHLGCRTGYQAEGRSIFCPCHGSRFDLDGRVTDGPAPRPLPRLELTLDRGYLVVDVRREVAPDRSVLQVG
jgi:cytochrome b6-f complex iron-sulfur subunit